MEGKPRKCKCGHDCHCYQPQCDECVNDVCYECDCKDDKEDIPGSMLNGL